MTKQIDKIDVMLHGLGGVAITALLTLPLGPYAIAANAAFWIGREAWQHRKELDHLITSKQVILEMGVPIAIGPIVWGLMSLL